MTALPSGRPLPPAVTMLGYELRSVDAEAGTVEVGFTARAEFANLMGNVQGGFVCAMLDSTASSALLAQLPADQFAPTIELKASFMRAVPIGPLLGRGRVVHRGGSIAFLEGSLHTPDGELLATASLTARIVTRR